MTVDDNFVHESLEVWSAIATCKWSNDSSSSLGHWCKGLGQTGKILKSSSELQCNVRFWLLLKYTYEIEHVACMVLGQLN